MVETLGQFCGERRASVASNASAPAMAPSEKPVAGYQMELTEESSKQSKNCDKRRPGSTAASRAHFRIDWRQLTYFHKEPTRGTLPGWLVAGGARAKAPADSNCSKQPAAGDLETNCQQGRRKRILNSLDGCFKSGQLSAILGPSGAGKSTFLSALFGNKQEASFGHTKVTWFPAAAGEPEALAGAQQPDAKVTSQQRRAIRIASLPQQDHLLNHLSVYESLMFASKLKNPHEAHNGPFHRANVRRVAKMLKLGECFQTRCNRLSGGQYKRVSIGQELLNEPEVIILDEPTSGLDAMTCLTTIRTLKSIVTRHPISIVLTIHQPDVDVFNLFDHVYVIAQGGMAIYEGPPGGVAGALAKVNLFMPSADYNPARFIVENAFVADGMDGAGSPMGSARELNGGGGALQLNGDSADGDSGDGGESELEEADELLDPELKRPAYGSESGGGAGLIKRSLTSLTDALAGKLEPVELNHQAGRRLLRDSGRKPLLNLAIQTSDGRLVTADALARQLERQRRLEQRAKASASRLGLLARLNALQKARYYGDAAADETAAPEEEETSLGGTPGEAPTSGCPTSLAASSTASMASSSAASSAYSEALETLNARENAAAAAGSLSARASAPSEASLSVRISQGATPGGKLRPGKLARNFDKRLSAKHGNQFGRRRGGQPTWLHARLLAHRTWLSIVRDPVFFGIQLAMHTTIPLLLALIFGSQQEEACPQVGAFDLVEFAYQPNQTDFIQATMRSIRQSIGNIGIMFFEMFVLSFAINCITALVFPLDMFVLLKEHRNGWYSLRAYFFGRTLADLPVPIVLHSLAMAILYYLTGQPLVWWRFGAIIAIVVLASLVAQSVGLTVGALLMRSSQSAVLAAAGIVAPFFALSGFIVRIHTLPWAAQLFAKASYLYHLLNGFIILRYGFGRCACKEADFEEPEGHHRIPANLKTMASLWIGTYSDEFAAAETSAPAIANRTNVDPNIDVIDKLLSAFKVANSFGHKVERCADVLPYAMLDFNLQEADILWSCLALLLMLLISRFITFSAIYYKIRSYS